MIMMRDIMEKMKHPILHFFPTYTDVLEESPDSTSKFWRNISRYNCTRSFTEEGGGGIGWVDGRGGRGG
jgi:hypothetical protein